MNAAPCSWRASTKRMRESASESRMSRISSPGRPNTYWTPSFSRHLTIRSDAFTGYAIQTVLMFTNSRMPYSDSSRP